jgi:hypothetical protein
MGTFNMRRNVRCVRYISLNRPHPQDTPCSYRSVLSSERAPYGKNNKVIVTKERIKIRFGHVPQRGA